MYRPPRGCSAAHCFLIAGFLLFTVKPQDIYPFPSGHHAASACLATESQNSRLAKARSGIKGVKRSRRQALVAKGVLGCKALIPKRSVGLQNLKHLKGVLVCKP